MMSEIRYLSSQEMGNCPAQVLMDSGIIEVNGDIWDNFNEFQKDFIIEHEKGHYVLDTDCEIEADEYALKRVYKSVPGSLKKSIEALYKVGVIDENRMTKLYVNALQIDALDNGNKRAIKELKNLGINKMRYKQATGTSPFIVKGKINRATGEDNAQGGADIISHLQNQYLEQNNLTPKPTKRGFIFKDYYLSFEVILLAAILFFIVKKAL